MLKDTAILICRRLTASKTGWSLWRAAKIRALLLKRKISLHPPVKTPEHPAAERILMALARTDAADSPDQQGQSGNTAGDSGSKGESDTNPVELRKKIRRVLRLCWLFAQMPRS